MPRVTPEEAAQAWAQRLAGSTDRIQRGVQSVTTAPGQAAARQKAVWVQNTQSAADKWARNAASVSLSEWQQATVEKGVQRIAAGAQAAQPKMAQFMGKLLPHIDSVRGTLPARGNLDQNIARMTTFVRGMSKFQK
jgi:hypothetical protein